MTSAVLALTCAGMPGASAEPPTTTAVTCTPQADYPHPSGHVNGTINSVGRGSCTGTVRTLAIVVTLAKSNGPKWSKAIALDNVSSIQHNSAASCSNGPGTFRTEVKLSWQVSSGSDL